MTGTALRVYDAQPSPWTELPKQSPFRIMRIEGDSMAPEYRPGDYVMVDTSHTRPGDGDFVLGKPYGIPMVKQVRIVHGANPRKLRVISVNPIYEPYEVSPEDIDIIGRVVGKWVWK